MNLNVQKQRVTDLKNDSVTTDRELKSAVGCWSVYRWIHRNEPTNFDTQLLDEWLMRLERLVQTFLTHTHLSLSPNPPLPPSPFHILVLCFLASVSLRRSDLRAFSANLDSAAETFHNRKMTTLVFLFLRPCLFLVDKSLVGQWMISLIIISSQKQIWGLQDIVIPVQNLWGESVVYRPRGFDSDLGSKLNPSLLVFNHDCELFKFFCVRHLTSQHLFQWSVRDIGWVWRFSGGCTLIQRVKRWAEMKCQIKEERREKSHKESEGEGVWSSVEAVPVSWWRRIVVFRFRMFR